MGEGLDSSAVWKRWQVELEVEERVPGRGEGEGL
jgi:hypothetical protein